MRYWARVAETAGFAVALVGYLLPFATFKSFLRDSLVVPGVQFAVAGLQLLDPQMIIAFVLPLLAAIAGLAFSGRPGWKSAVARLGFAAAAMAGLALAYVWQPSFAWGAGYDVAAGAFLVAGIGSAVRLVAVMRLGQESAPAVGSAWSASQELLRKHSR